MGTEAQNQYPPLAEISTEGLGKRTKAYLAGLCRSAGLPDDGLKAELIERLTGAKESRVPGLRPGDAGHVHGRTRCRYCGAGVRVMRTARQELEDDRTLITRYVRCNGRHQHSYPIKEIEKQPTAETAEAAEES